MPKHVRFIGKADRRILNGEDLAKDESVTTTTFEETIFERGIPVQLNNDIVDALVKNRIFGDFEEVDDDKVEEITTEVVAEKEAVAALSSSSDSTPSSKTNRASSQATGNRSSTR